MINIANILELDRLAKKNGQKYKKKRYFYHKITDIKRKHFLGIIGARGVGKTVLLKQLAYENKDAFYLSLDTFEDDIFDVIQKIHQELGCVFFLLDEVHMHSNFDQSIKKIYDFLDVKIIFTSSIALAMYSSGYDLSRRVILETLYPFSFREYLDFKHNIQIDKLSLDHIIEGSLPVKILHVNSFFDSYLQGGILPFALEEIDPLSLLSNIVHTVIQQDIVRAAKLSTDELPLLAKLLAFVGRSEIDGINYSSISNNLKITKYKAEQYVDLLAKAFILHRIMPKGTNILKEPKIVMALPYRLLYRDYDSALGCLREDFFVESIKARGEDLFYLKSTRGAKTPDYLLPQKDGIVFEIGGKSKGRSQFKNIKINKKIILTHSMETKGIKRPLFLAGLL